MQIDNNRVLRLKEYVLRLMNKENGQKLYQEYKDDLDMVSQDEAFAVFSELLDEGKDEAEILDHLGKVINVFSHSLDKKKVDMPKDSRFLDDLIKENSAMLEKTEKIKEILRKNDIGYNKKIEELIVLFEDLNNFSSHYAKKENILFAYLETNDKRFEGLSIMWSLHDRVRKNLKEIFSLLKDPNASEKDINIKIGQIFFDMLGLKYKEENILFPAAIKSLDQDLWTKMYEQSMEYDFALIDKKKEEITKEEAGFLKDGIFNSPTGKLTFEQLFLLLDNLPLDLTLVDENNKVRFFSRPKDRIFPRSKAVIGRDVNKCHPPQSVHIVEEIVQKFRSGEEDCAKFWLDLRGKKILIQYFALRDEDGNYKGVLEASQDITQIQKLSGQRRIVDWSK